jgi:predicted metal-dependent HD superfamily phosphohydrolase
MGLTADDATWRAAWAALGTQADMALLARLRECWCEPHRHYHTLQHLEECFSQLDALAPQCEHVGEVVLALWFHDAVYDPHRADNEARSAEWAHEAARAAGAGEAVATRLHALVMATGHGVPPRGSDERIVVDVDLAILGAKPSRFDEYERQVRSEYAWVPDEVFRTTRRHLLEGLLARPAIYSTPGLASQLEARARSNLQRSLAALAA